MSPTIPESELVLNEDGSVYHLNLHPHEIAETIVLVGDPDRVYEVSKHFDSIELRRQKREFITQTGRIGNTRLSVLSTGIGTDNIDIALNELDILANVDLETRSVKKELKKLQLVRIGTSGALQEDIPLDSILLSTHAIGLDGLLNYYEVERNKTLEAEIGRQLDYPFIVPYIFEGSPGLLERMNKNWLRGITATCVGFYAPQVRSIRKTIHSAQLISRLAALRFEKAGLRVTNFEMETAAIYGLSKVFGFDALSVNVILANRIQNSFSKNAAKAINTAIVETLERLTA